MCGIAGILTPFAYPFANSLELMANSMQHRGPNGSGTWFDENSGIGFAHRRLSIVDLSPHGSQPMTSSSGRFVICYNGEIYNHTAIRLEIEATSGITWKGHSDTEVLLEAIEHWGICATLERCNGMFSFAIWDKKYRTLTLARDRFGEKPLYIGRVGRVLAFASELKALRCLPDWQENLDQQALGELLRFGYISAPRTIQQGVFKLPAACKITFDLESISESLTLNEFSKRTKKFWQIAEIAAAGNIAQYKGNEAEASAEFEALLYDAVRLRIGADVPIGAMLSGGIDSSLIVAMMQKQSSRPIKTFTIGFEENRFNEAHHARLVASCIGTEHTEIQLSAQSALDAIPNLPNVYDEPFADPSQIPTLLVSQIASKYVTVALSGDGGDELFFGYSRYANAIHTWQYIGKLSARNRHRLATNLNCASLVGGALGFRLRRLAQRIDAPDFESYYRNLISMSPEATSTSWPSYLPGHPVFPASLSSPSSKMRLADQHAYLPENILTKVDRASMAASLELRSPLIDHRIAEFAWQLPEKYNWNGKKGKLLMRNLLYRLLPRKIVDRPKQGFEIPLDSWLRGPLREWMLDCLAPSTLRSEGLLQEQVISKLVIEHLSLRKNHGYALWPVLMFQAWRRNKR